MRYKSCDRVADATHQEGDEPKGVIRGHFYRTPIPVPPFLRTNQAPKEKISGKMLSMVVLKNGAGDSGTPTMKCVVRDCRSLGGIDI